eukprot:5172258-Pleurochrysis_carterae.AAC.2
MRNNTSCSIFDGYFKSRLFRESQSLNAGCRECSEFHAVHHSYVRQQSAIRPSKIDFCAHARLVLCSCEEEYSHQLSSAPAILLSTARPARLADL